MMGEWIKVGKRLPDVGQIILVYEVDGFLNNIGMEIVTDYALACMSLDDYDPRWDAVTHWMPLPEPPKDDE